MRTINSPTIRASVASHQMSALVRGAVQRGPQVKKLALALACIWMGLYTQEQGDVRQFIMDNGHMEPPHQSDRQTTENIAFPAIWLAGG